jgi:hypothetical protein
MESTPKTASEAKQAEAKNQEQILKAATEKERSDETGPPHEGGNGGGENRPSPENPLPPASPWYTRLSLADWITAISAAITALATVVIMVWAGLQWWEMHTGGVDTHALAEAARQQAWAASKSAQAARDFANTAALINGGIGDAVRKLDAQARNSAASINATQEAMRLDQRAWVGVGSPSFVIKETDPLKAETRVVILGKSPAIDIVSQMGLKAFPSAHVFRLDDIILDPKKIYNGTAFPASTFPIREKGDDPISDFEKMVEGSILKRTATLYFFGEITYQDIFKVSHWTHFCYVVIDDVPDDAFPCAIYNDSDADDPRQRKMRNQETN